MGFRSLGPGFALWGSGMARILLIDGSGYIFRAYYGVRSLTSPQGEPTNAVYGFATMLDKILREETPDHLVIAFDAGGPNFRHRIYPQYKANRPPPPEDLIAQIPRIRELVDAFRIPQLVITEVEADDVLATLTRLGLEAGYEVEIITGDKDLMQLVGDGVRVYEPMKAQRFGPDEVFEKFGVYPGQIADALALAGDTSDNIPGVKGVGLKTAAKLLGVYRDLNGVLEAATQGDVKGKLGERLVSGRDDALLSRKLVALDNRVDLGAFDAEQLRYTGPNRDKLRELYEQLDFRRLLPKLEDPNGGTEGPPAVTSDFSSYHALTSLEALGGMTAVFQHATEVAIAARYANDGLRVDAEPLALAVSVKPGGQTYFVGAAHDSSSVRERIRALMDTLSAVREVKVFAAKGKLVLRLCSDLGVPMLSLSGTVDLASYLLEPDATSHDFAAVARRYLGHTALDPKEVLGTGRNKREFESLEQVEAMRLLGEEAELALALLPMLFERLREADLLHVLFDIEMPLLPVLVRMERHGVRIDLERLRSMSSRFETEMQRLENECYTEAGQTFNLNSPKQLQKVLFEDLGLKIVKRTKSGPSTDHSVLEALADAHSLPLKVLEYRQVQKLKSTYIDALPRMVSSRTGRVHTIFNQTTAATGRLSSTDPNLQNIPIRTELGRELRKVFIADPGHVLISVDYSQIELRILAHLSADSVLTAAFREGADVHARTASALFGVASESVTREQRTQAKAVNFGVLYGMGPVRLARELKIPRRTASKFVEDYFERQPGVKRFIDETLEYARTHGHVRTILGRRRLLPDLGSKNRGLRASAERVAINTPIQGSAADLIKLAMIRVDAQLSALFPAVRLLLQVHDELVLEASEAEASTVATMVKLEMERAFPLDVPLVATPCIGPTWDDAH
jgi:DNA polymerase I